MGTQDDEGFEFDTRAVRAGSMQSNFQEHSEALFLTSSFTYKSAAEAARKFANQEPGFLYSRFTNPTVTMFQQRLASLEGAEDCVAAATGMAAIAATVFGLLKQGDHLVSSRSVFGTVVPLFDQIAARLGITTTWVNGAATAEWQNAIQPNTKLLFCESPSNPLAEITDIRAVAKIANAAGAIFAVDNCLLTPALQRPLELGADLVVHSATKYLDGQGRVLAGAVCGSKALIEPIYGYVRTAGAALSPFNAWVCLKGLETLRIRIEAQSDRALELATWLGSRPSVRRVHYAGLESHPQHRLALTQAAKQGAVLAFEVEGGQQAAWRVIDACKMISITANLGDTKSTITHPATTTHARLSDAEREAAGISDGLLRVAVGLESVPDLSSDLDRSLCLR
jgi:O-succinylhomoserine sulfhydrylase